MTSSIASARQGSAVYQQMVSWARRVRDYGEPIWVTAERQGQRTAPLFWPGSEAAIRGVRPTVWKPFDAGLDWPREVAGVAMSAYHRWMEVTTIGTLINAPVLAVPAGFGPSGLPIGLQVIGRNHDDHGLLELARRWALDRPAGSGI